MCGKSDPATIWEKLGSFRGILLRCQKTKSDKGEGENRDNTGQPHNMLVSDPGRSQCPWEASRSYPDTCRG